MVKKTANLFYLRILIFSCTTVSLVPETTAEEVLSLAAITGKIDQSLFQICKLPSYISALWD